MLNEAPTFNENGTIFGGGVTLEQFQSVRDQLLQLRIYEETQQQSNSQTQLNALNQVEGIFSDPTKGVGGALSAFFNSISQLSTNPTDSNARQAVLTSANNLAGSFHQAVTSLNTTGAGLDQSVPQTVDQINRLTTQIAKLNGQVAQMQGLGQDPGTIQDQRDELIRQLSGLVNVNVTQSEHGLTLTTGNGVPLVVANQSYALQSNANNTVLEHVYSAQGQDITSQITGGQLGGTIQIRDQVLPQLFTQLNNLASQFTASFNTAHEAGFDAAGNAGREFLYSAGIDHGRSRELWRGDYRSQPDRCQLRWISRQQRQSHPIACATRSATSLRARVLLICIRTWCFRWVISAPTRSPT